MENALNEESKLTSLEEQIFRAIYLKKKMKGSSLVNVKNPRGRPVTLKVILISKYLPYLIGKNFARRKIFKFGTKCFP